jgi:hypothetical protein
MCPTTVCKRVPVCKEVEVCVRKPRWVACAEQAPACPAPACENACHDNCHERCREHKCRDFLKKFFARRMCCEPTGCDSGNACCK